MNSELTNQDIFGRVVTILEQARNNIVRTVNSNMVMTYWIIGREIVQDCREAKSGRNMENRSYLIYLNH